MSDEPRKNWPCKLQKGRIAPCWALDEVLQLPGGRGTRMQGVEVLSLVDLKTFKFTRNLIVLKSGKHGKKGLTMNVCPFCSKPLVKHRNAPTPTHSDPQTGKQRGEM